MSTHSAGTDDEGQTPVPTDPDEFWRRPAEPSAERPDAGPSVERLDAGPYAARAAGTPSAYPGPPSASPPAPGWRPPVFVQPAPPRRLPAQDLGRLAADERRARTFTYGVGMVAGAVLLVVMCLLCSRIVF